MVTFEQKQKWTKKLNDSIREVAANLGWLFDDRIWRFEKTLDDGAELWCEGCVKSTGQVLSDCTDDQVDAIITNLINSIAIQLRSIECKHRNKQ